MIVLMLGAAGLVVVIALVLWKHFGFSLKLKRCEALLRHGEAETAVLGLRALEEKYHGELRVHQLLAEALMASGEYRQAVHEWELVLLLNRRERVLGTAQLAGSLADCQMALGEWREAQGGLLLALKTCPAEVGLLERLAVVYLKRGMARHAVSCYEAVVRLDGESVDALIKLATVQEIAGDLKGALATALNVLRLDAKNCPAALLAARLYSGFGNHAAAEQYWRILAGREEYRKEGLPGLAACIEALPGRRSEAIEAWMSALEVTDTKPARVEILYRMAGLFLTDEDIRRAVILLGEVVSLDPDYKDASLLLKRYAELHTDGDIGRFVTGTTEEFRGLAGRILSALGVTSLRDKVSKKRDLVVHGLLERGDKRETVVLHFSRSLSPVSERELQEVHDELRVVRGKHAWVFSVVGFSDAARSFSKSRQFSLVERDEIRELLGMVSLSNLVERKKTRPGEKTVAETYERAAFISRIRQRAGVA